MFFALGFERRGATWVALGSAERAENTVSMQASPVPSLLVLDQPSQVYFPRTLAKEAPEGDDPALRDEDVAAVRKVFETLAAATASTKGLQILVLDHASDDVWQGVAVHEVEEWRNGKALVPAEWLGAQSSREGVTLRTESSVFFVLPVTRTRAPEARERRPRDSPAHLGHQVRFSRDCVLAQDIALKGAAEET